MQASYFKSSHVFVLASGSFSASLFYLKVQSVALTLGHGALLIMSSIHLVKKAPKAQGAENLINSLTLIRVITQRLRSELFQESSMII